VEEKKGKEGGNEGRGEEEKELQRGRTVVYEKGEWNNRDLCCMRKGTYREREITKKSDGGGDDDDNNNNNEKKKARTGNLRQISFHFKYKTLSINS